MGERGERAGGQAFNGVGVGVAERDEYMERLLVRRDGWDEELEKIGRGLLWDKCEVRYELGWRGGGVRSR